MGKINITKSNNNRKLKYDESISKFTRAGYSTIATEQQPRTFSNQPKLPRLPIPDLQLTSARYKRTLLPLLTTTDYESVSTKIDRFFQPGGLAEKLQSRLYQLDEQEAKLGVNWLDRLWLKKAYLEYRIPTLINVNWWNQFKDPDTGLGKGAPDGQVTDFQFDRSASMIAGLVDYSNRVNK